jgi:hypothetical protein
MKKGDSKRLTPEQAGELESLAELPDDAIDTSDAPELLDWSGAKRGMGKSTTELSRRPREPTQSMPFGAPSIPSPYFHRKANNRSYGIFTRRGSHGISVHHC